MEVEARTAILNHVYPALIICNTNTVFDNKCGYNSTSLHRREKSTKGIRLQLLQPYKCACAYRLSQARPDSFVRVQG